jgi:5'-phosphate synthase pdxT subunit
VRRVGVLSLQGDVGEHVAILEPSTSTSSRSARLEHLESVEALIVPGGESTTIAHLLLTSG